MQDNRPKPPFPMSKQNTTIISKNPNWPSDSCQESENDVAQFVIICKPGLPKFMGAMHPAGALYERPVNVDTSIEQHDNFRRVLESYGITVLDVKEILMMDTDTDVRARIELEQLAATKLTYVFTERGDEQIIKPEEKFYVGDTYKMQVIEAMSSSQLVDLIMTNPTVHVSPSYRDTNFTASYSFKPLSNLVFTRDQQITTRKGIVMCRLTSAQRQNEVELMKFCFKKLNFNVIGEIPDEGRLEGGDFFPAGKDLCMIGIGLRSNQAAVDYMLKEDLLGTKRVAVVKDQFEQSQDRMHLDCVFNIISPKCCLMYQPMMGEESPVRRLVDEWAIDAESGTYKKVKENVEFAKYITDLGYHIIPVTHDEQLHYGCNGLNLGNGNLICINKEVSRKVAKDPLFQGKIRFMEFDSITSMYGGCHCASQVVKRAKPSPAFNGFS